MESPVATGMLFSPFAVKLRRQAMSMILILSITNGFLLVIGSDSGRDCVGFTVRIDCESYVISWCDVILIHVAKINKIMVILKKLG